MRDRAGRQAAREPAAMAASLAAGWVGTCRAALATGTLSIASVIAGSVASTAPAAAAPATTAPATTAPAVTAPAALPSPAELDRLAAESVRRWQDSGHGGMLLRILPQHLKPSSLPEADSEGARLTALYCVQCHFLPSPAMHEPAQWERVVERMLPRMRGQGNMGKLMAEMMLGPSAGSEARPMAAPTPAEARTIVAYLRRNAMRPIPAKNSPQLRAELATDDGRTFSEACSQCHALPDPKQHIAADWPAVVQRMQRHMKWMNHVVGTRGDPREPQLRPAAIVGFLQRNAASRVPR